MKIANSLQELEEQVIKGLEKAYKRMVEFKKQRNSPLIVSEDGKVVEIKPEDILPTTTYKR